MTTYTVIDGRSHKWDNPGEVVTTLVHHYWWLVMRFFGKSYCRYAK